MSGVVYSTGLKVQGAHKHHAKLAEFNGRHLWCYFGMWHVANPAASHQNFDIENLLTVEGPACFWCEESLATNHRSQVPRRTKGEPVKPSISRDVHYVSYGTPGGEFPSVCRAAKVTEVHPDDPNRVGLFVMNPTGVFFHSIKDGGCHYDAGGERLGDPDKCPSPAGHEVLRYCACGWQESALRGGTWHWPERVEE